MILARSRLARAGAVSLAVAFLALAAAPAIPAATAADPPLWSNRASPAGGFFMGIGGSADYLVASQANTGTYRSQDGGRHWAPIVGFPEVNEAKVAWDSTNPDVGYVSGFGGVARTLDGGRSWDHVISSPASYRIDVSPTGRVAAMWREDNFQNHVVVSDDHLTTFRDVNAPLPQFTSIYGLSFGRNDREIAVMSIGDMWVTHDEGATWTHLRGQGQAGELFADAQGVMWRSGNALSRSTDGGLTWTAVPAPSNGNRLAVREDGGLFLAAADGILYTPDGGATWTDMGYGEATWGATSMLVDPTDPLAVFLTDENLGVVHVGPDGEGGYVLEGRTTGLPPVDVLALGRSADGALYLAGGPFGVYASRDQGRTWGHTGAGMGFIGITALGASADGASAYAGGQNRVFQPFLLASHDGGRRFEFHAIPFGGDGFVRGLVVDPADARHLWLAVTGDLAWSRVMESKDGGATWTTLLQTPTKIWDVALDATTGTLLAATEVGVLAWAGQGSTWTPRMVSPEHAYSVATAAGAAFASGPRGTTWRSAAAAAAPFAPWALGGNPVVDLTATPDGLAAWATLRGGKLARCGGDAVLGACSDATPPQGKVQATMVSADGKNVYAATKGAGLWSAYLPS